MELNKILSDSRWGDMAALINTNFEKIKLELMKLRFASILTFCKGYFSTESRFLAKFPTGKTGEYAFVGTPWPGTVYEWIDTAWANTGVAPQLGESIFVELLKQHIDNTTIYWDEVNEVIKSAGGAASTHTITVGINTADIGKCTVTANGAVVSTALSDDGGTYTILANAGGTVTVKIEPEVGYQVQTLNVDQVSQGAITEYTFKNLDASHTMYVWMEVAEEIPTEFLVRSDLPGMYYSSTQDVLNAMKASYPNGLTKDITITCVKPAREKRGSDLYVSRLRDWNKGTVYTLTLDGADKLVYDCNSFGGLEFTNVNNVVIKDIDFVNASTYIAGNAAEELAAVAFIGNVESRAENFYAWNCRINTSGNNTARYGFITKFTRNIYLVGNTIKNSNCYSLKMLDCDFLSLVRNNIECTVSTGIIGHPALCYITNSYGLVAEDNKFTGSTGEYLFNLTNVARAYFRRNSWIDCGGEAIRTSSQQGMKTLTLESNLFNGVLTNPSTSWTTSNIIIDCNVDEVSLINNTGVINGKPWQQWFLKQADTHSIDTLNVFNNVISDFTDESVATRGMVFGKVRKINSGNNLYRLKLKSGETDVVRNTIFSAVGLSGTDSISRLQSQGLETGSVLVGTDVPIFQPDSSKLLATLEYYADARYLPSADVEYKHPADANNTIGCYNLAGIPIDETLDEVLGYTGRDFTENQGFTSAARYSTYAENILMFMSDTLVRERFVHMLAKGTHYQNLLLGRYGLLQLMPKVDANGEYQENEFYTVEIE